MVAINKEKESSLTQEKLKEVLHYDPDAGVFTWLARRSNYVKAGDVAGTIEVNGYISIQINEYNYKAHRLAWLYIKGRWPSKLIDHRNQCKSDNSFLNLRLSDHVNNGRNRKRSKNNKSGMTGVHFTKQRSAWIARIKIKGKITHLGQFKDFFEACCARKSANNKYNFYENHGNDR